MWCWDQPHQVICFRHLRWLGDIPTKGQPDLSGQPEILAVNRRHHRLIRRHGRETTGLAFARARYVCQVWDRRGEHQEQFQRLMSLFHGPSWRVSAFDPTVHAASYPQIVALTRLLASPFWWTKSHQDWPELTEFAAELRRTVAPDFRWALHRSYGVSDPLVELILEQRREHDHDTDDNQTAKELLLLKTE